MNLRIKSIDHLVITTSDIDKCLHFYVDILGMEHDVIDGQHMLFFGSKKINLHTSPG